MTRPLLLALALLAGCRADPPAEPGPGLEAPPSPALSRTAPPSAGAAVAETVYVPVYSHIYFRDRGREIDLAATLSVRNADPERAITVRSVGYFDSDGRRVRQYLEAPVALGPLASRAFVVEDRDRTGGVGASFLVAWEAAAAVAPPVVEAVMIGAASSQGISFVTRGRTVRPAP